MLDEKLRLRYRVMIKNFLNQSPRPSSSDVDDLVEALTIEMYDCPRVIAIVKLPSGTIAKSFPPEMKTKDIISMMEGSCTIVPEGCPRDSK